MTAELLTRLQAVQHSTRLRDFAKEKLGFQTVAERIVRHLYESLPGPQAGQSGCPLVRLFKTHPYGELPADLQAFARRKARGQVLRAESPCLVLMATAGDLPEWNSPQTSAGHRAIPVHSKELVAQSPMIMQLLRQFGVELPDGADDDRSLLLNPETESYGIFHIPEAKGSPHVPAQAEFIQPLGIQSVVGCGAPLTARELFALILFSRVPVSPEVAARFSTIALAAKLALIPQLNEPILASAGDAYVRPLVTHAAGDTGSMLNA